jgi:hypothetical protein
MREAHYLARIANIWAMKWIVLPRLGLLRFPLENDSATFLTRISDFPQ